MMNFFPFGKKIKPDATEGYLLSAIPLFSALSPDEQGLIEQHSRLVSFKRGDVVYEEGTPPDAFHIIVSGRFRLFTRARDSEQETTLLYFYRGEHFGETSLLTGNVHSASVEAKTDAVALRISAESFHKLIKEIPSFALQLSRSLGRHLTREELGYSHHRREVRIASFYAKIPTPAMTRFLLDFMAALKQETGRRTLIMDLSGTLVLKLPPEFTGGRLAWFDLKAMGQASEGNVLKAVATNAQGIDLLALVKHESFPGEEKKFVSLLTYLTYQYDYVALCLPEKSTSLVVKALNYSDRVYLWAENRAEAFSFAAGKVGELCRDFGFSKNEVRIVMPHGEKITEKDFAGAGSPLEMQLFSTLPSLQYQRYRYERMISFLAREWSERLVGLVLGSGAAYGLAHIGVLRVLEQEKIPVDVIAGSSIGALMGAFWAAGYDSYEIEKIAKSLDRRSVFFKLLGFGDVSAPHMGFFKGRQIIRFLTQYFKDLSFQDLKIPLKVNATDLLTSKKVVFESGSLVGALRATVSIPGFFRPFQYRGGFLLDGGILDPLPIKTLSDMGVKKIIAVNVLPGPRDLIQRNELRRKAFHDSLQATTKWKRMVLRTLDRIQRRYTGNIFNVIMNTIQFMEFELAHTQSNDADIFIHAAAPNAHWVEFFSSEKFIEEGARKTREQLAEIKQLLVE